jgi:hypothetical protein
MTLGNNPETFIQNTNNIPTQHLKVSPSDTAHGVHIQTLTVLLPDTLKFHGVSDTQHAHLGYDSTTAQAQLLCTKFL